MNAQDLEEEISKPLVDVDELEKSFEETTYSLPALRNAAQSFDAMIREFDMELSDLTLQLRVYSQTRQGDVSLVLKVPTLILDQVSAEEEMAGSSTSELLFAKSMSLPQDFSLFLYEFDAHGPGKGQKTMIADGPVVEGVGSDSLLPSLLRAVIFKQNGTIHTDLQIALKALRVAVDISTLRLLEEILGQELDLPLDGVEEEDGYFSPEEDDLTQSQVERVLEQSNSSFGQPSFMSEGDEDDEFFDCEDMTESVVDDMMFKSIITNPPAPQSHSKAFNVTFSMQQASLSLLHADNMPSSAVNCIFERNFDLNSLTPPPVTPYDHSTAFIEGLEGTFVQSPTSTTLFEISARTLGVHQYVYRGAPEAEQWDADDFVKMHVLSVSGNPIKSTVEEEISPPALSINYSKEA